MGDHAVIIGGNSCGRLLRALRQSNQSLLRLAAVGGDNDGERVQRDIIAPMKIQNLAGRVLKVLLISLILAGCSTITPVEVNNGQFTTQDPQQSYLGFNEAIQRLSKEIKTNPSTTQFTIKWQGLYPGGGPDALVDESIQYDKQGGTLIQEPFHYHGVTDEMIHTLAQRSKSGKASGMADDLPELGATKEAITPSQ